MQWPDVLATPPDLPYPASCHIQTTTSPPRFACPSLSGGAGCRACDCAGLTSFCASPSASCFSSAPGCSPPRCLPPGSLGPAPASLLRMMACGRSGEESAAQRRQKGVPLLSNTLLRRVLPADCPAGTIPAPPRRASGCCFLPQGAALVGRPCHQLYPGALGHAGHHPCILPGGAHPAGHQHPGERQLAGAGMDMRRMPCMHAGVCCLQFCLHADGQSLLC